jgi:hypothetical protein
MKRRLQRGVSRRGSVHVEEAARLLLSLPLRRRVHAVQRSRRGPWRATMLLLVLLLLMLLVPISSIGGCSL